MIITAIIISILGYGFNAVMDVLQFRHDRSIFDKRDDFSFFGRHNYMRKYKIINGNLVSAPDNWYYRTFDIKWKERFPLSATSLVWLADGWHFAQFMMYNCFALAPALLTDQPLMWFLIIRISGGLLFTFMYNHGLEKR